MCKYCDTSLCYIDRFLIKSEEIDGTDQDIEIGIFEGSLSQGHILEIDGALTYISVEIKYCPICGNELK